jgi:hypothetical protein
MKTTKKTMNIAFFGLVLAGGRLVWVDVSDMLGLSLALGGRVADLAFIPAFRRPDERRASLRHRNSLPHLLPRKAQPWYNFP